MTRCWSGLSGMSAKHYFGGSNPSRVSNIEVSSTNNFIPFNIFIYKTLDMETEKIIAIFNSSENVTEISKKLYGKNNGSTHKKVYNLFKELNYDWEERLKEIENSKKKYCLNCGKEIPINKRSAKKFCNSSCAATYNNKLRKHSEKSKQAASNSLKKYHASNPVTNKTKSAISDGLKKYHSTHVLTDKEKWERYCKRYNQNVSFEEYVEFIMGSSHNSDKIRKRKGKKTKCLFCGKELDGTNVKFCSADCRDNYEKKLYDEYIEKWERGEEEGHTPSFKIHRYVKRYLFEKNNNSCQNCGWGKINEYSGNIPLQIHHIDGDCTNNKEENLQLLCPNCHALTDNFGSRNKNSKRVFRRQKLFKQEIVK